MSTKPPYPYPNIRRLVRIALSVLWVGILVGGIGLAAYHAFPRAHDRVPTLHSTRLVNRMRWSRSIKYGPNGVTWAGGVRVPRIQMTTSGPTPFIHACSIIRIRS